MDTAPQPSRPAEPPAGPRGPRRHRRLRFASWIAAVACLTTGLPALAASHPSGAASSHARPAVATPAVATPAVATPAVAAPAVTTPAADAPADRHVAAAFPMNLAPRVTYDWPTGSEAAVLRPFDAPAQNWQPGHRGVDLQSHVGAPVRAAADGVVAFAGSVAGRPLLSVDHADGLRTTYEPVAATVSAGTSVRRGDVIGALVADPRLELPIAADPSSFLAAHGSGVLHWGARTGKSAYIDPLSLLRAPVIRLLPV